MSTPTSLRDEIVNAVRAHTLHPSMNICTCRAWRATPDVGPLQSQFREHLADVLAPLVPRVEITEHLDAPTTARIWRDGVLVFDGVDRSVLLPRDPRDPRDELDDHIAESMTDPAYAAAARAQGDALPAGDPEDPTPTRADHGDHTALPYDGHNADLAHLCQICGAPLTETREAPR